MGKRGWMIAAAGLLAAIAIGIVIALAVRPAATPKATPIPDHAVIAINPTPSPTSAAAPVTPAASPPAFRRATPVRAEQRPKPSFNAPPDPDPVVVTTINSW